REWPPRETRADRRRRPRASRVRRSWELAVEDGAELLRRDRLGEVRVAARLERAPPRLLVGEARQRDDAHRRAEPFAYALRHRVAVEPGQADVEQHEIRRHAIDGDQRLLAVA